MKSKKIIVVLGVVCFAASSVLSAGKLRHMDSLNVAHKAKVGAGLVVNGGADIIGAVNMPSGPLNVMNNKLKVDSSGVNVSGQLKVNGQSVGGSSSSVSAPFEVKGGSTSLFRVDTNSNVTVGRTSGTGGTVQLGMSASSVQLGTNCSSVTIGKSGGQVNLNGTVKVNGSSIGSGGSSGTVKGTFEVKNTGGTTNYFRVDGSSGDAQFTQDLLVSGKTTLNGDLQLKGQLLDEHGDPIEFGGGGASGEVTGPFVIKNEAGDPYFDASPYEKTEEGLCGDIVVHGNLKVEGALTDKNDESIGGGEGGGSGTVLGNFVVKGEGEGVPPTFEVNVDEGKVVVNGSLVDGEGKSLVGEGSGGISGTSFGQMADVNFTKDIELPLLTITPVIDVPGEPMLVDIAYASATDSFNLCVALTNGETPSAAIIGGFAKIDGTVVSDVTAATSFVVSYDGTALNLTLKAGSEEYSTGSGVLFFRVFGNTLDAAAAYSI